MIGQTSLRRICLLGTILLGLCLVCGVQASAASAAKWRIDSVTNTSAAPGSEFTFYIRLSAVGHESIPPEIGGDSENCVQNAPPPADPAKCFTLTARFPAGLKPLKGHLAAPLGTCSAPSGNEVTCSSPATVVNINPDGGEEYSAQFTVRAGKEAEGRLTSFFEVAGAEAGTASTVDPTIVTPAEPQFGVDAFDALATENQAGAPLERAGAHPYQLTNWVDFNTHSETPTAILGPIYPVEPLRDAVVDLPPGFIGNPSIGARCTGAELGGDGYVLSIHPACPAESQVGLVRVKLDEGGSSIAPLRPIPLFNMVPPPGAAARFGFNVLGTMVLFDAHPVQLPDGSWTVEVATTKTSEGIGAPGIELEFWGDPASPEHELDRHCPGAHYVSEAGPHCPSAAPEEAFFRMPTSCSEAGKGLPWAVHVDSWFKPGAVEPGGAPDLSDPAWKSQSFESHLAPGYPLAPEPSVFPAGYSGPTGWGAPAGTKGCGEVPFYPTPALEPTTNAADSPAGLAYDIHMPQQGFSEPGAISESDVKAVSLKLPEGMTVNAAAAGGRASCSAAQIGLETPVGQTPAVFNGGPQTCPDASKVGSATIETPLLTEEGTNAERPLSGGIYLAAQGENPFGSLLALYLVVEDPQSGTVLKLPGEIKADPTTGQLETAFENLPQLPFSNVHAVLFGGPRAAVKTPSGCGTFQAQATLTPWSGNAPVTYAMPVEVTSGPGGTACPSNHFEPELTAGTANPLAGKYSDFNLKLTRHDGEPTLGGLRLKLPSGLLANLKGIPYCPESVLSAISGKLGAGTGEIEHPSCPAASQVGTVTVGAGAGPEPFFSRTGKAYWAGPYKGAPVSLAVVVPAVAGPFDLGNVVVRNAFEVNPETAEITSVSDPFPTILHGVTLDVRDVRLELNRPEYTRNPTSCDPMSFNAQISSPQGPSAQVSPRFQVAGCEALGFKPKLSLTLKGSTKRSGNPSLSAVVTMPPEGSNIAKTVVSLPHSEFLDNSHINSPCTRVQFNAGGGEGEQCPAGSEIGYAWAYSPILDYYLQGPVYLRSNGGERELPDVVASLGGQIHVDVVGFIDTNKKTEGLRTTFASVPDAPVSKFVLKLKGGKRGLIENSTDLCAGKHKAIAAFTAHNAKTATLQPVVKPLGCGKGGSKHQKHGGGKY